MTHYRLLRNGWWQRLAVAALVCTSVGIATAEDARPGVRLVVDYGDGVQKSFVALEWKEKMTVLDALQAAARHSRGIKFLHAGTGETVFVSAIDDLANEGRGGRNWRYSINDRSVPYSAGVAELRLGDAILWHFRQ
jgi:Domain of unknown function (DUF4430)